MTSIHLTTITFPEIQLKTRDAHKLRGYFCNLFIKHSPLLHNHYDDGRLRYRYPLVQYKVLGKTPALVAINEGAELLVELFLKIKELQINGDVYPVHNKNIESRKVDIGYTEDLVTYHFETLWMALNQHNYREYKALDQEMKLKKLNQILIGNVLSFYKEMNVFLTNNQRIHARVQVQEKTTLFKDRKMIAFKGDFLINALLPDHIGIGKAVSRGFGVIYRK